MTWQRYSHLPLDLSQFERAYYWVRHDGLWFISEFFPDEQEFFFCGQVYGFNFNELEAIECVKIVQPSHLINAVWEDGKCIVKPQ